MIYWLPGVVMEFLKIVSYVWTGLSFLAGLIVILACAIQARGGKVEYFERPRYPDWNPDDKERKALEEARAFVEDHLKLGAYELEPGIPLSYLGLIAKVDRIVPLKSGDFTIYCRRERKVRKVKDVQPDLIPKT